MYHVKTFNAIAQAGLDKFTKNYQINAENAQPDAYMIRSVDLHDHEFPQELKVIARCGAGFNNIPLDKALENGTAVFNTPGGNANAVKELVVASMIMASRNIIAAVEWSANAKPGADITLRTEKQKTSFNGTELLGKKIAVIGMGHVGSLVANAAIDLGMEVIGYDPYLSVDSAWQLDSRVERAQTITAAIKDADFVTVHVPKNEETTGLISEKDLPSFKRGAVLLNYSRLGVVDNEAAVQGLANGTLKKYYTDFSDALILNNPDIVIMPHIGGSTIEAEINCAQIAADEIMEYLETGNIKNSVNLPDVSAPFASPDRFTLIHKNIPNMLGQISTFMADEGINIENLVNRSRGNYAYTMLDVSNLTPEVAKTVIDRLSKVDAITRVRLIHKD